MRNLFRHFRQIILKKVAMISARPFELPHTVLIVAPHPDDETFGCGGFIADQAASRNKVDILFLTPGESSHSRCCDLSQVEIGNERRIRSETVTDLLGISKGNLCFLEGKDGHLPHRNQDGFNTLAQKISSHISEKKPDAVFCPHPFEGWSDHIAAAELTHAAMRMLPGDIRPKLYYYCVWFWYSMPLHRAMRIDWRKARLLEISRQLPAKKKAMRAYLDPVAPCGNPWVGRLPKGFLRAFEWARELYFEVDINEHGI